jgi:hypothetical protein
MSFRFETDPNDSSRVRATKVASVDHRSAFAAHQLVIDVIDDTLWIIYVNQMTQLDPVKLIPVSNGWRFPGTTRIRDETLGGTPRSQPFRINQFCAVSVAGTVYAVTGGPGGGTRRSVVAICPTRGGDCEVTVVRVEYGNNLIQYLHRIVAQIIDSATVRVSVWYESHREDHFLEFDVDAKSGRPRVNNTPIRPRACIKGLGMSAIPEAISPALIHGQSTLVFQDNIDGLVFAV